MISKKNHETRCVLVALFLAIIYSLRSLPPGYPQQLEEQDMINLKSQEPVTMKFKFETRCPLINDNVGDVINIVTKVIHHEKIMSPFSIEYQ